MSNLIPTKRHMREVLLYLFNLKKSAAEAHRLLTKAYGECVPSLLTSERWIVKFRSGYNTEYKDRPGQELEALLHEDSYKIQQDLAKSLVAIQPAILKHLRAVEFIQDQGNGVPYELKPRDLESRCYMSEMMLERYKTKAFLHGIITCEERGYVKTRQSAEWTPKIKYPWR